MRRESKAARRRRVLRNRVLAIVFILAFIFIVVIVINAITKGKSEKRSEAKITVETRSSDSAENTVTKDTLTTAETAVSPKETTPSVDTSPADSGLDRFDTNPPVITAPSDIYVSLGDTVAYKSYIHVEDDYDSDPKITVDNSQVNLSAEGTYPVVYTATDSAGNFSSRTVNITVGPSSAGTVSEDVINQAADQLLNTIIDSSMSDLEKVQAIFFHVRDSYTYTQDDGKLEYKQEAYKFMQTGKDSCYANVCLSKLLLERCGFESVMVQGPLSYMVIDSYEYHYWNLVSIDGGENWYVYDSAWWTWEYEEYPLCMMTEEMAMDISERHGGLYNYDPADYPAISNIPLWDPEEEGYYSAWVW